MQLHRGQKTALNNLLGTIQIQAGRRIDLDDWGLFIAFRDQILQAPPWKNLIGEADFGQILWSKIHEPLFSAAGVSNEFVGALSDPALDELRQAIDRNVTAALEALPRFYDVYIPFGGFPELGAARIEISTGVALVDAESDEELAERLSNLYPKSLVTLMSLGSDLQKAHIHSGVRTRYLHIQDSGFGNSSPDSPVVRAALAKVKHFVAVGLQSGAIVEQGRWAAKWDDKADAERTKAVVLAADTAQGHRIDMPVDLMAYFHGLRLDESQLKIHEPGLSLLGGGERAPSTPEEMAAAIKQSFARATEFLGLHRDERDAGRIRAAMEWQIDAAATNNESIAFLQRCIALEALLGSEESQRSVSERLSDRYAYLLGQTESQRDTLRKRFREMYGHRSEIVHGRAGRLSEDHSRASSSATVMLKSVLEKETGNLLRSLRRGLTVG